jgi:EAL domain-containing protein (putative c-di-GMP-specific phosphodiesterase class I)
LPVDSLKIDRSFVLAMAVDDGDRAIVRSTIELAHNLGLQVVAEGVEDELTARLLVELGCDRAQGYFFGRPAARFEPRIDESSGLIQPGSAFRGESLAPPRAA